MNLISEWSSNSDDETCDTPLLVPHWKSELERRDPLHRYSKNLRTYNAYWTTHCRTDADDDDSVWLWLTNNPSFSLPTCPREVLERQRIAYLSSSEREKYRVDIVDGVFLQNGVPLTTSDGDWIFVLSKEKLLYANIKVRGAFHHTSFLAGHPCLAAGGFTVTKGRLEFLLPHSGHYRPSEAHLRILLQYLRVKGVDLRDVECDAQRVIRMTRSPDKSKRTSAYYLKARAVLDMLAWKENSTSLRIEISQYRRGHVSKVVRVRV
jgi:hypothetical protein